MKYPSNRRKRNGFLHDVWKHYRDGKSDRQLARELNSTHQEVFKARKKLGLKAGVTAREAGANYWHNRKTDWRQYVNDETIEITRKITYFWSKKLPHLSDEFESEGYLTLVKASQCYVKKVRKCTFEQYLKRALHNSFKNLIKKSRKYVTVDFDLIESKH